MDYGLIIIKFVLGIVCLIFQINILGYWPGIKLRPRGIIYNSDITVLQFVMVLLIWTLIVFVVKFAKEHNHVVQKVIDGQPRLLIKNGLKIT